MRERGALMIEATYSIVISLLVAVFTIAVGYYIYQYTLVNIVANEVANEVAQTYKYKTVDTVEDITPEAVADIGMFRYLLFEKSFNSASVSRAGNHAEDHLDLTSLALKEGGVSVTVETIKDNIGRRHYKVSVSRPYSFMMGSLLEYFGLEKEAVIRSEVYVESMDVLHHVNTVRFTEYLEKFAKENDPTGLVGFINSVLGLIKSITDG